MRSTYDVPEDLINEAKNLLGFKSKSDVVIFSLKEMIRRARAGELRDLAGKLKLNININKSRRR